MHALAKFIGTRHSEQVRSYACRVLEAIKRDPNNDKAQYRPILESRYRTFWTEDQKAALQIGLKTHGKNWLVIAQLTGKTLD